MTAIALRSDDGRRTTEDSGQIGRAGIIRRWVRVVCHLAVAALIGLCFAAPAAMAAKKDNALRVADDQVLDNVDPYFNNVRIGVIVSHHVWDTLIYRDPKTNEYQGQLATSWKWIDQKTLELELRKGVKFHNGAEFDADDVVYTLNFVSKPENKATTQSNVDWIDHVEKLDTHRVRIVTRRPFPAAIEYLAGPIAIHPHAYYAQVGPQGMNQKPIGSGPYRVVEHAMGKYIRLVRNPDYFKDSPKPQPQIENVELRFIPDRQTQVAEMLSGGLDLIKNVPLDQAQQLRGAPSLQVVSAEIMRYAFLQMDSTERTLAPQLRDPRVRKAIMHAIDRAAMVKSIVGETSRVLNVPCFPSQFGCSDEAAPRYAYDPAKAKQLLAEAGYPSGFDVDLYGYRDRDQLEAMIGYLHAVGIRANLRFVQYAAHRDAVRAGKAPIAVWTWGSFSINDVSAGVSVFHKWQADDTGRDPEVRELLDRGDSVVDPQERKAAYAKALGLIAERAHVLPLYSIPVFYVAAKDLVFVAYPDEVPRFWEMRWK
ncbi:MAG TPA: ABC transporter substrate-binding protein [Xanthobacteraceae bacterium]